MFVWQTTSFGIQFGLQKANVNFYSAVEEAKSKIVRQGTAKTFSSPEAFDRVGIIAGSFGLVVQ